MASFDRNDYGYYPTSYVNNTEWGAEPRVGTPITEVALGNEVNPNYRPMYNRLDNLQYGSASRYNQRANPNQIDPSLGRLEREIISNKYGSVGRYNNMSNPANLPEYNSPANLPEYGGVDKYNMNRDGHLYEVLQQLFANEGVYD